MGFYFFPGVPNGTELGQEMDQLFHLLKTKFEENRQKLWKMRYESAESGSEKIKAQVNVWDIPIIVFGGTFKVPIIDVEGTHNIVERKTFVNAFNDAFQMDLIHGASDKCGYFPTKQTLLNSGKLRREIIEGEDEDEGEEGKSNSFLNKKLLFILLTHYFLIMIKE